MHASLTEWWNSISLRTKITSATVLLLTLGLVVSGLGTMIVLRDYLIGDLDTQIDQALQTASLASVDQSSPSAPTDYVYAVLDSDGSVRRSNMLWQDNPPDVGALSPKFVAKHLGTAFTVQSRGGDEAYRLMAETQTNGETIVLGLSLDTTSRLVARLFTVFFLFGIVVVILGAVLTRLLVSSTFGPLRQVEKTAEAIADGDFGQRLGNTTANTEVARLNRSLNRMLNRIDRALADRARTIDQMRRFVGDASHELRTPLVSVRGYAELYRMGALQTHEDVAQAMDRIEREAIRLGALVSDLLALARLDESKPMTLKPVELLPLAHDAALDARALAPTRTISVTGRDIDALTGAIEVLPAMLDSSKQSDAPVGGAGRIFRRATAADGTAAPAALLTGRLRVRRRPAPAAVAAPPRPTAAENEPLPLVLAEEDKIRQVLANLIGNAIRFTPSDSPIDIGVYADERRNVAVLEVIDHGEGIPPQIRDKIFQRFWRADSSRTRDTGGSGLGLAIVAAIVAAHNGSVGISETPGGGATFRVTFPLLNNDAPTESIPSETDGTPLASARS